MKNELMPMNSNGVNALADVLQNAPVETAIATVAGITICYGIHRLCTCIEANSAMRHGYDYHNNNSSFTKR